MTYKDYSIAKNDDIAAYLKWEEEDIEKDTGEKEEGMEYYHTLKIMKFMFGENYKEEKVY